MALFVLLTDLESETSSQAFFEAAVAVKASARRFPLLKGLLRMVQLTAARINAILPARARDLFKDFDTKWWNSEDVKALSSEFPNVTLMMAPGIGDTDVIGLSELLEMWEGTTDLAVEYSSEDASISS